MHLAALVRDELARPVPAEAQRFAEARRRLHGDSLYAVLFYGSCLRRRSPEGVLDFYALVDDYRRAYASRALAAAAAALPPTVHYLELDGPLRAKYAVLSRRDFARGVAPGTIRSGVWARFCQPVIAVFARDDEAFDAVAEGCATAIRTAVATLAPLLPGDEAGDGGDAVRADPRAFWELAFRETYSAEMRTEQPETIAALYRSAPERFDAALRGAVEELARRGELALEGDRLVFPPGQRARARRRWRLRVPAAKALYLAQLGKTAATFGDWLPYALWKLERHGGSHLVPTPRQRAHPVVFGWPLLFRALWRREFR